MPDLQSRPTADGSISLTPPTDNPTPVENTYDEAALVDKISDSFATVFGADSDDPVVEAPEPEPDEEYRFSDEAPDDNEHPELAVPDDGSAVDDLDESGDGGDDATDPPVQADAPTIPLAHERSLLASHTRDEIKQLHASLGEDGFADYASRQHEKRNAETARMAELGRLAKTLGPAQPLQTDAAALPHHTSQLPATPTAPTKIEPVSVEALRAKFGDDDLIDTFATQMNAQASVLNQMLQQQEVAQQQLVQQEQAQLARQVNDFFGGPELATFKEHYGSNAAALTPEQQDARVKVLEMADALTTGARYQGRNLDVNEALSRAHSALSVDVSEASVRSQLRQKAKRRNRGITSRPTGRSAPDHPAQSTSGPPANERELEARTRARMQKAFGG